VSGALTGISSEHGPVRSMGAKLVGGSSIGHTTHTIGDSELHEAFAA
jgi:hypothetical protein